MLTGVVTDATTLPGRAQCRQRGLIEPNRWAHERDEKAMTAVARLALKCPAWAIGADLMPGEVVPPIPGLRAGGETGAFHWADQARSART
jgi:hypothetical protein